MVLLKRTNERTMANRFSTKYQGQAMKRIGFLASEDQIDFLARLKEQDGNPSQFIRVALDERIEREKAKQRLAPQSGTHSEQAA